MADVRRVPAGRAGRLWLRRRIQVAERGIDLLDRKLRILRGEQQHIHVVERSARQRWEGSAREASKWLLRAVVLGGERELRLATATEPATVEIMWSVVMGVSYPSAVTCHVPQGDPGTRVAGNSAMRQAALAHAEALTAAAEHAVALQACRAVDTEISEVRRRLTAISNRWLPRLIGALNEMEHRLEEAERSENSRLRRFASGLSGRQAGQ
jgi:V/A-type H+-transporting ATPase subunit D